MKARILPRFSAIVLLAILGVAAGCAKAPNDASITKTIQSSFNADSGLQGKQLTVESKSGTVTLSGTVDNQAERDAASRYAAAAPGVKQVVNNLQIASAPAETAQAQPDAQPAAPQEQPAPEPARASKPSPSRRHHHHSAPAASDDAAPADDSGATTVAQDEAQNPPPPISDQAPAPAPQATTPPPPPPPPPPPQKVTIPAGTIVAIRLVDPIDSETSQAGQTFRATLDSPLTVDGSVVIPSGYDVVGHIVEAQSAGKFQGRSELTLQLDRIKVGSHYYDIQTSSYHREGASRGKNTAEKVGAGGILGAIIGGIAGGGKGAAIGAAAGAGVGGGVQAATKAQQVHLPSETVINFTLQSPVTVTPISHGPRPGGQRLENP
jgi:BON domain